LTIALVTRVATVD